MAHLDPELLALLALGEDAAGPEERLHLAGCPECREEVRRFGRPVAASREEVRLAVPGPQVWQGIAAELGLPPALEADPLAGQRPASHVPSIVGRRRRARRGVVVALAAAAAVLLVGGVAVGLLTARPDTQRIASADLEALPGWQGRSGTAVLERRPDGREVVEVSTTVQPDARTDHEVWLMTAGAKRLVSLGMLHGTSGTFTVPSGVDVNRFRLVDVSDEPRDGDTAHSGDSIVRGELRF